MAVRSVSSMWRYSTPLRISSRAVLARYSTTDQQLVPDSKPFPGVFALLKEKTGETGKVAFGVGVTALLFSKELIIVHAELLVGMSVFGVAYWLMGKIGQPTAEFLDNRAQNMLDLMNTKKNLTIAKLEKDIETEKKVEGVLSCRDEVFDIIRDEAEMQREELYRSRLDDVRTEVKRRLDYQLQLEGLEKTFQQRHLVSWLEDSVRESVTTKPDDSIPQCISSLKKMAATSS